MKRAHALLQVLGEAALVAAVWGLVLLTLALVVQP